MNVIYLSFLHLQALLQSALKNISVVLNMIKKGVNYDFVQNKKII